jgi:hypothetical protein
VARPLLASALGDDLDRCPHCGSRLSSIDLKFNRCLGCGKPPVPTAKAEGEAVSSAAWTVHL